MLKNVVPYKLPRQTISYGTSNTYNKKTTNQARSEN